MNGAITDGGDGIFHEAGLVQSVGMNSDLNIEFIGDRKTDVDGCGGGPPVFVQVLSRSRSGENLLAQRLGSGAVSFA